MVLKIYLAIILGIVLLPQIALAEYTSPQGDAVNFTLVEYTVPQGDVVNFELVEVAAIIPGIIKLD